MNYSFKEHVSELAQRYAEFRPEYPEQLFDYLATLVPGESIVWDCAAGNGQATRGLATRFLKVIATDASAGQIALAPHLENVVFRRASAEDSGLENSSVDMITVAQALHWFDLTRFFKEADRVLKPHGVLAIWSYGINQVEGEGLDSLVEDFYTNVVGTYWPPERTLVEEGYRSIELPFSELKPPRLRMEASWALDELLGYFSSWSATNKYIKHVGKDPIPEFRNKISIKWGNPHNKRKITWPLVLRVGRK